MLHLNSNYSPRFPRHYERFERKPEIDYDSGTEIIKVSSHELPQGVRGMYCPNSHTIYLLNNLYGSEEAFVRAHESGHAQGITDEYKTDCYAANKTGKFQYIRSSINYKVSLN